MQLWLLWIIVAGVFLVVELCTTALVSIWFVPGALLASLSSVLTSNIWVQIVVFIVVSLICFPISKSLYDKKIKSTTNDPGTVSKSLVGKTAIVIESVSKYPGRVVVNDVYWKAISEDGNKIPSDSIVQIIEVRDLTLIVKSVMINDVE